MMGEAIKRAGASESALIAAMFYKEAGLRVLRERACDSVDPQHFQRLRVGRHL